MPGVLFYQSLMLTLFILPLIVAGFLVRNLSGKDTGYIDNNFNS